MEIVKGNILIAKFMGYQHPKPHNHWKWLVDGSTYANEGLKFDISWGWIMPVGKKILDVLADLAAARPKNTACKGDLIEVDIHCAVSTYDIEKAWQHMVKFIQWYNEQKQSHDNPSGGGSKE